MIKKILIGIVLLIIIVFAGILFFGGSLLRAGVEKGTNYVLQVPTEVGGGTLNIFSGNVGLSGLKIGNPPGFKSEHAIVVGDVRVAASVSSFMSDTVVIDTINIDGAEITVDLQLGKTNLGTLVDQAKKATGGNGEQQKTPAPKDGEAKGSASKKMKIREINITNAKLRVAQSMVSGAGVAIPVPTIVMHDIGGGEKKDETDLAGVITRVLNEILKSVGNLAGQLPGELANVAKNEGAKAVEGLGSVAGQAGDILKKGGEGAVQGVGDAIKGVGDIFKKK
ncbi:MAG: AsmA family protein [Planctomycetes bacterium]|nr:AsmA family protein [Planctomycetota bacterium]